MKKGGINVYEQQVQMGLFLHRYYDSTPIAMHDIGAISFFSRGKNLDLEGLGNVEVAQSRKDHYWTSDFLYAQCKKDSVRIAIVYDQSYPADLRNHWYKIALWWMPDNVACYSDEVTFYAVDSSYGPQLKANLRAFQPSLPGDVVAVYRDGQK